MQKMSARTQKTSECNEITRMHSAVQLPRASSQIHERGGQIREHGRQAKRQARAPRTNSAMHRTRDLTTGSLFLAALAVRALVVYSIQMHPQLYLLGADMEKHPLINHSLVCTILSKTTSNTSMEGVSKLLISW